MQTLALKDTDKRLPAGPLAVLLLTVNNHPGVMSHVCGLFARRAFNLEGIMCLPADGGAVSRMWLLVTDDERLPQVRSQLAKLEDVLEIERAEPNPERLSALAALLGI